MYKISMNLFVKSLLKEYTEHFLNFVYCEYLNFEGFEDKEKLIPYRSRVYQNIVSKPSKHQHYIFNIYKFRIFSNV